jgi:transposase
VFEAFVERVLGPELRPGDVVVMDNLLSHKGRRSDGRSSRPAPSMLYLPSYRSDLSPIEPAFCKIKQLLRTLAARTRDALWSSIRRILAAVTRPTPATSSSTAATHYKSPAPKVSPLTALCSARQW